ncbi:hypothetical protein HUT18_02855 [Streptomyces sp. NA04227]|uniref:hypothetical protein n=1 Tax=Streptomyces sp. NA04227 TaxID=2742136 RepID=UPI0015918AEF|nr:hypothetical protein [Streptomyces sp. NA04227]QKW05475.1 hypothetical protein HUT18_02855 [Streptomyces sp. NA04227]
MSSGHSTMTGFLAAIVALLLVITGLVTEWPYWAWPAAAAALAAATSTLLWIQRRRTPFIPPECTLEPQSPLPPVERWEQVLKRVPLPTAKPDYDCLLSATVRWRPEDAPAWAPVVNYAGLAVNAILERASQVTAGADPTRLSLTEHVLSGELAVMESDDTGRLLAMAVDVRLTLSDEDRERLQKLATVRKNEAVWEHERRWEISRRSYLSDDVLKTTGSAVVWWLAKNDDKIDKTVSDIGLLTELASAANDQPVPRDFQRFVPGLSEVPEPEEPVWEPCEEAEWEPEEAGWEAEEAAEEPVFRPEDYFRMAMDASGVGEDDAERLLFMDRVRDAAWVTGLHDFAVDLGYEPPREEEPDTGDPNPSDSGPGDASEGNQESSREEPPMRSSFGPHFNGDPSYD